uniref:Uncharacterized protein n=1 Tax=Globodera pallida TaxID=36090 RepID=A0A183C6H6_GLOPA
MRIVLFIVQLNDNVQMLNIWQLVQLKVLLAVQLNDNAQLRNVQDIFGIKPKTRGNLMFGKNNTLKSKIMASKIKECLTITITPAISHLISSAQLVVVLDKWREVCLEHKILNIWAHRNLVMTIQFIMIIIWAHRNMAIHFIMLDLHKLFLVNVSI